MARSQGEVAHLTLDATGIASIPTGDDAFLENFVEDGFMEGSLLPRGE